MTKPTKRIKCKIVNNNPDSIKIVALNQIPRGHKFKYCGYEWIVIEHQSAGQTLALAKKPIALSQFDTIHEIHAANWANSPLRKYLNGKFLKKMCGDKPASIIGFRDITSELTADDGTSQYHLSVDTIALLTGDLYRQHRDVIKPINNKWWLITAMTTTPKSSNNVQCVNLDGTLTYEDAKKS